MADAPNIPVGLPGGPEDSPAVRLFALWRRGQPPDLRAFLAGAGHLDDDELTEVLCTDQRERWLRGDRPAAETYLQLH